MQIFPGFTGVETIIEDGAVKGIRTGAFGVGKKGEEKATYQPPMELRAKLTLVRGRVPGLAVARN